MKRGRANRFYTFFALFLLIFITNQANAQIDCDITIDSEIPVCPGGKYTLSVPYYENAIYHWKKDGVSMLNDTLNTAEVTITEETVYSIIVTDKITLEDCMSDILVTVRPAFTIEFEEIQLTCTASYSDDNPNKTKTGRLKAIAVGMAPPESFTYLWDTRFVNPKQIVGDSTQIIGLGAFQIYPITVVDNYGCSVIDTARTTAFPNADCEIFADPDTAFIQNPKITFSFINNEEEDVPVTNFTWNFGDCECLQTIKPDCCFELDITQENPTHTYDSVGTYNPYLITYNKEGCDTLFGTEVRINPIRLFIPNVFTPNPDDDINSKFVITESDEDGNPASTDPYTLSTYYQRSELVIFNRWGRIVYTSDDYQNDWDGGKLPDGVYFYVLKCFGAKSDDVYKGSVTIFGSGR